MTEETVMPNLRELIKLNQLEGNSSQTAFKVTLSKSLCYSWHHFRTTSIIWNKNVTLTILDFNEAWDNGVQMASTGPYANYLQLHPDNHASTSWINFYKLVALSDANKTITILRPIIRDYPGEPIPEHHPLTPIMNINHPISTSSIHHNRRHPPCSICMFDSFLHNLCLSPLWSTCGLELSSSYSIHFFTQSLSYFRNTWLYSLTCFAVIPRLRPLHIVSLISLYFELCLLR